MTSILDFQFGNRIWNWQRRWHWQLQWQAIATTNNGKRYRDTTEPREFPPLAYATSFFLPLCRPVLSSFGQWDPGTRVREQYQVVFAMAGLDSDRVSHGFSERGRVEVGLAVAVGHQRYIITCYMLSSTCPRSRSTPTAVSANNGAATFPTVWPRLGNGRRPPRSCHGTKRHEPELQRNGMPGHLRSLHTITMHAAKFKRMPRLSKFPVAITLGH